MVFIRTIWAKKFPAHSAQTFATPLTYAGYKDVPVTYLLAESDQLILPEVQLKIIENIESARGEKIDVLKYDVGHFPHISQPGIIVEAIQKVAAKA